MNKQKIPLYLANNLISIAKEENISLAPIILQKLIYFIFRDYAKKTKTALFKEKFETWKYGPVIPSIYHYFKKVDFYKDENDDINILKLDSDELK